MSGKKVDSVTGEALPAEVVQAAIAPAAREGDVISAYLKTEVEPSPIASEAIHRGIIEEILSKTTLDEILGDDEPEELGNFVGRVITITGYTQQDSEFPTGPPVYFNIKLIDKETGEHRTSNTSEQNVMAQLLAIERNNLFPFECRPEYSKRPNKYNRSMIRLKKADN